MLGGYAAVKEKMEAEHQERKNALSNVGNRQVFAFVDAARKGDLQSATSHFASLTAGFAQHSKKMFELNKIAALADATVSMGKGIAKSLSEYPMPWAALAAAGHAALFAVQLSAIRGAKFGGGSAPSVSAGGFPATPVSPVLQSTAAPSGGTVVHVHITGMVGTQQFVDEIVIPQIKDAVNNRDFTIIGPNSRQAQELMT